MEFLFLLINQNLNYYNIYWILLFIFLKFKYLNRLKQKQTKKSH